MIIFTLIFRLVKTITIIFLYLTDIRFKITEQMNKKLILLISLVHLIFFTSYSNNKKQAFLNLFKNAGTINLTKLKYVSDNEIRDAIGLCYYKQHLLTVDYSIHNKFITIINLENEKITHQITRGRTTHRLLSPRPIVHNYANNCLTIFDDRLAKMINYDLINSKLTEKKIYKKIYKRKLNFIGSALPVDSTRILMDGVFSKSEKKYLIKNINTGKSTYFGSHPKLKSNKTLTSGECFLSMPGTFTIHPSSQKAVHASYIGSLIDFIDLSSEKKTINRKEYFTPKIEITSSKARKFSVRRFEYDQTALVGCRAVKATKDYVYALFIGNEYIPCGTKITKEMKAKQQAPTLLQFDWNGNPIQRWSFKIDIANFDINPETNEIYVMTKNNFNIWKGQL